MCADNIEQSGYYLSPEFNGLITDMPSSDTQFKVGNDGGPGRPKGSRSKLSEAFLKALSDDFTKNGLETVEKVRKDKPDAYLNVIGKLMPKLMELSGPDGSEIPMSGTVTYRKVDATTGE